MGILTCVLAFVLGVLVGGGLTVWFIAANWRDIERKVNTT